MGKRTNMHFIEEEKCKANITSKTNLCLEIKRKNIMVKMTKKILKKSNIIWQSMGEHRGHWVFLHITARIVNINVPPGKKKLALPILEHELLILLTVYSKNVLNI